MFIDWLELSESIQETLPQGDSSSEIFGCGHGNGNAWIRQELMIMYIFSTNIIEFSIEMFVKIQLIVWFRNFC